jgi:hypothetical protein
MAKIPNPQLAKERYMSAYDFLDFHFVGNFGGALLWSRVNE